MSGSWVITYRYRCAAHIVGASEGQITNPPRRHCGGRGTVSSGNIVYNASERNARSKRPGGKAVRQATSARLRLRELTYATCAPSHAQPGPAHVARLEPRQAAKRRARLDGAAELRIVRERERLEVRGELRGQGVRERVAVEVQLREGGEAREVGREAPSERGRREVTGHDGVSECVITRRYLEGRTESEASGLLGWRAGRRWDSWVEPGC